MIVLEICKWFGFFWPSRKRVVQFFILVLFTGSKTLNFKRHALQKQKRTKKNKYLFFETFSLLFLSISAWKKSVFEIRSRQGFLMSEIKTGWSAFFALLKEETNTSSQSCSSTTGQTSGQGGCNSSKRPSKCFISSSSWKKRRKLLLSLEKGKYRRFGGYIKVINYDNLKST
jgi:hypothetical protein